MQTARLSHVLLVFPLLLSAANLPQLSLEDMVIQSEEIVSGQVVRSRAAMDPENKFIWTHYEIKVDRTLKGQSLAGVIVAEPGGTLDGVSLLVPGSTRYTVGEAVTVFLYRTPIGYLRTTNYGQGKWKRVPDAFEARITRIVAAQREARR